MAKYRIRDSVTGKTLIVSGDAPPTEREAADLIRQALTPTTPAGIKNYAEVEERIKNRKGAYQTLQEELSKEQNPLQHPLAATVQPLVTGVKAINALIQPPISAIANAGMAAQEDIANLGAIGKAAWQGLTQERPGSFSDVIRRGSIPSTIWGAKTNPNIPFSETLGFLGEMGALNAASLGKLGQIGPRASKVLKESLAARKYGILDKVDKASQAIKQRVTRAGLDIGQTIRGEVGKKSVNINRLQKVINKMPQSVRNVISEAPELKRLPDGSIAANVQNVNTMKKLVGDVINNQTFKTTLGSPAAEKRAKKVYDVLSRLETRYAPELKPLNKRYSEVIKQAEKVLPKLESSKGELLANPVTRIAAGRSELSTEKLIKDLSNEIPELSDLMKAAKGRSRALAVQRFVEAIGRSGASGIGAYGAVRAANPR